MSLLPISGPLTVGTVGGQLDLGQHLVEGLVVDLAQVEAVDSAAVSLLLAWLRQAQHRSLNISFDHIPENLLSLACLYGVVEFLPLRQGNA